MVVVGRLWSLSVDRNQMGNWRLFGFFLDGVCMESDRRNGSAGTWDESASVCTVDVGRAIPWVRPTAGRRHW